MYDVIRGDAYGIGDVAEEGRGIVGTLMGGEGTPMDVEGTPETVWLLRYSCNKP